MNFPNKLFGLIWSQLPNCKFFFVAHSRRSQLGGGTSDSNLRSIILYTLLIFDTLQHCCKPCVTIACTPLPPEAASVIVGVTFDITLTLADFDQL